MCFWSVLIWLSGVVLTIKTPGRNYMKNLILAFAVFIPFLAPAQNESAIEKALLQSFIKIAKYDSEHTLYDSLEASNTHFADLLVATLNKNPESIHYDFKKLKEAGLNITTAADKKFRIYSWDDMKGGTMRFVNNVYQTRSGKAQSVELKENDGFIIAINILKTGNTTFYLVTSMFKGSSALFLQRLDIYKTDVKGNVINAPVIKTASRITRTLSCEADYSARANHNTDFIKTNIVYITDKKEIHLPLILADGKITNRKIVYRFKGKYFEKIL